MAPKAARQTYFCMLDSLDCESRLGLHKYHCGSWGGCTYCFSICVSQSPQIGITMSNVVSTCKSKHSKNTPRRDSEPCSDRTVESTSCWFTSKLERWSGGRLTVGNEFASLQCMYYLPPDLGLGLRTVWHGLITISLSTNFTSHRISSVIRLVMISPCPCLHPHRNVSASQNIFVHDLPPVLESVALP